MANVPKFKDFDSGLKTDGRDLRVVYDTAAVAAAIENMLLTGRGERPMRPYFGINMGNIIGEPVTDRQAFLIESMIKATLATDPRLASATVAVSARPDDSIYEIAISFRIADRPITFIKSIEIIP